MTVYTRAQWGSAHGPAGYPMGQAGELYVHHYNSGISPPRSVPDAMARIRGAQHYHAVTQGWGDIGYTWLVDDLGNIYEGRGWWRTGAHTAGYNSKGYAVCGLLDSTGTAPSEAMVRGIAETIRMGIAAGALVPQPTIVAHSDRNPDTACCGALLYRRLPDIRQLVVQPTQPPAPTLEDDDDVAKLIRTPDGTIWSTNGVLACRIQTSLAMLKGTGLVPSDPEWGTPVGWHDADDLLVALGDGRVLPMRDFRRLTAEYQAAQMAAAQ